MSDKIEAEILDALGEEVDAAVDTPLVVIEGPKGDTGDAGKDGHSPVVTAAKSGKTTTISVDGASIATIEDGADGAPGKNGADGHNGAPGAKGADGITPTIGPNGNWYLGDEDTGVAANGAKGDSPVKGVDYWTEAEKAEIVEDAKTEIGLSNYAKTADVPVTAQIDINNLVSFKNSNGVVLFTLQLPKNMNSQYTVELSDGVTLSTVMFNDDFDGSTLGSTWKPSYGQENAAFKNWWTADSKNLGVEDSCLRLTMLRDNPTADYAISSAMVETMQYGESDNYGFDTGYCEARFKLDKVGDGIWPAIWCVGQIYTNSYTDTTGNGVARGKHGLLWPWAGEIDQFDAMKSSFVPGLIYQADPYVSSTQTSKGEKSKSIEANTWYTVGMYKSKDTIKVYFDRELIASFDITGNECFSGMGERLIINLSTGTVGGTLPDNVDEVNMYIDYVRVYSLGDAYTTLEKQNTASLLPEYCNGYAVVPGRSWALHPLFADNTQNTYLNWNSSDLNVAKVENGYITSIANGNCNITAKDSEGNSVISFALEVKSNAGVLAQNIAVTSQETNIEAAGSVEITAKIYPTQCDVLTPTLSVVSGTDYCEIEGNVVKNTNSTDQTQTVVIRVGTNNPTVYENVEMQMLAANATFYDLSVTDGLACDFQPKSGNISVSGELLLWKDAISEKVVTYRNASFDGVKLTSTSTIDALKAGEQKAVLAGESAGTIFGVFKNLAAQSGYGYILTNGDYSNATKLGHYTGVYFNSSANARIREMPEDGNYSAVWQSNIGFTENELIVVVIKFANGIVEYSLFGKTGQIGTTGSKEMTNIVDENGKIGALFFGLSNRGNGIKGDIYRNVIYNRALTSDEITTVVNELIAMHG